MRFSRGMATALGGGAAIRGSSLIWSADTRLDSEKPIQIVNATDNLDDDKSVVETVSFLAGAMWTFHQMKIQTTLRSGNQVMFEFPVDQDPVLKVISDCGYIVTESYMRTNNLRELILKFSTVGRNISDAEARLPKLGYSTVFPVTPCENQTTGGDYCQAGSNAFECYWAGSTRCDFAYQNEKGEGLILTAKVGKGKGGQMDVGEVVGMRIELADSMKGKFGTSKAVGQVAPDSQVAN